MTKIDRLFENDKNSRDAGVVGNMLELYQGNVRLGDLILDTTRGWAEEWLQLGQAFVDGRFSGPRSYAEFVAADSLKLEGTYAWSEVDPDLLDNDDIHGLLSTFGAYTSLLSPEFDCDFAAARVWVEAAIAKAHAGRLEYEALLALPDIDFDALQVLIERNR